MTIKQLTYLVEINKTGSFTTAAKNLYVSQSVISLAIKELEKELGFKIFDRNSKKLEITQHGYLVLNEAKVILSVCNNIKTINKINTQNILKVRTFDYSLIMNAFNSFAQKYADTKNTHLSLKISEYNEIINGVIENECDLGILIFPYDSKYSKNYYLDSNLLEIIPISKQQMYVKLRQEHPVLKNTNIFNELKDYKLVHFRNESFYPSTSDNSFVDFNNTIYINDKEGRNRLVSTTNAYLIGMSQTSKYKDIYNLVEIPIDNNFVEIVCFYKKDSTLNEYANEFITLLIDEFNNEFK